MILVALYLAGSIFALGLSIPMVEGSPHKAYWIKYPICILMFLCSWGSAGWIIARFLRDLEK